jgi:hypothetical protein
MRNDWQDVSREDTDSDSVMQASLSAPPDGYRSALQLARLILLGASIDHAGRLGGQTFTLSLSRVWEDAVIQMCRDLEPQTGWRVEPKSIRPWDDAMGSDDKYRSLIADTLKPAFAANDRWKRIPSLR